MITSLKIERTLELAGLLLAELAPDPRKEEDTLRLPTFTGDTGADSLFLLIDCFAPVPTLDTATPCEDFPAAFLAASMAEDRDDDP